MFRLLLEVFAQAQFIGFGLWSIWYCVFYVSPTIQKLDSKPAIVIRYTGCIYFIAKMGLAIVDIYTSETSEGYRDYYFGSNMLYSWIDVIWYLMLSQFLWSKFFLKFRCYRLFNGILALIPPLSISILIEYFDGATYIVNPVLKQVNLYFFYLINVVIYLMTMVMISFFIDKWRRIKPIS